MHRRRSTERSAPPWRSHLAAVTVLMAVAACGGDDVTVPDPPIAATTVAPTAAPTTAPPETSIPAETTMPPGGGHDGDGDAMITEHDDGETYTAAVGEELIMRLSSEWAWDQPRIEGDAVVVTPVDYLVDPGYFEWILEGASPGTAELHVDGSPNCADASACPDRTVEFTVNVSG